MATDAQINANRENAKKSTGPKTPEGKARAAQNALKYGFYSKEFIVREEDLEDFEQMRECLHNEVRSVSPVASEFFMQMLHASWNLHRLRQIEERIYCEHDNPFGDENISRQLETLARHRTRFERTYSRALKELRDHETNLALYHALDEIPGDIPPIARPLELRKAFRQPGAISLQESNDYLDKLIGPRPKLPTAA